MAEGEYERPVRYDWRRIRLGTRSGVQAEIGGLLMPVPPAHRSVDNWGAALTPATWNAALTRGLALHGPEVPDGQVVMLPVHRFHPVAAETFVASVRTMAHHRTPDRAVWWWLPMPRADLRADVRESLDRIADLGWTEPLRWDPQAFRFTRPTYADGLGAFVVPSLWMASYALTRHVADRRRMVADLAALAREAAAEHVLVLADTAEASEQIPLWAEVGSAVPVGWLAEAEPAADLGSAPAGA